MRGVAKRRVHLCLGAELPIDFRRGKGQMLRRHLDARHILVQREQLHLRRRRHMQHVHAFAGRGGEPQQLGGRGERGLWVAPFAVACRVAVAAKRCPLAQARFVFGVKGGAPLDESKDAGKRLLVVDEKVSGGRAHEHLDAGGAWKLLKPWKLLDILSRGADEEGEVAIHASPPARDLVGKRPCAHRCRLRIRHLEHGGDAAKHRRAAARLEIFLVLEPRLAEMHLRVDDTWQNVQANRVDGPPGAVACIAADRHDTAVLHADIGKAFAGMIDQGRALDEEIEGFGQDEAFAEACGLTSV